MTFRLRLGFELGSAKMVFMTPTITEREAMRDEIAKIFPGEDVEVDEVLFKDMNIGRDNEGF